VVGKANSSILHTAEDVASGKPRELLDAALREGKWEALCAASAKMANNSPPA
jgi:hypothetical protein